MDKIYVLAQELWLQVEPLHDFLRHAQDWIHWLDLFISKQREACHSKQGVKRVHLERKRSSNIKKTDKSHPDSLFCSDCGGTLAKTRCYLIFTDMRGK